VTGRRESLVADLRTLLAQWSAISPVSTVFGLDALPIWAVGLVVVDLPVFRGDGVVGSSHGGFLSLVGLALLEPPAANRYFGRKSQYQIVNSFPDGPACNVLPGLLRCRCAVSRGFMEAVSLVRRPELLTRAVASLGHITKPQLLMSVGPLLGT